MVLTNGNVNLGRVLGIPVRLHWSWFIIFGLITLSLAVGYFPSAIPNLAQPLYWGLGLSTSLLFFLSILAHEFGHALIAKLFHIRVQNITLLIFGGVAQIAQEPRSAGEEFSIAIAGPAVSLAAGLFFGFVWLTSQHFSILAVPCEWLARINLALVAFNMIPGFPLDGGRVFRSILWWITKSQQKATRFTGYSSQVIALGFIGFGVFSAVGGNIYNAIWLVFVGWFLQNSIGAISERAAFPNKLEDIRVSQIMNRNIREIPGNILISTLVDDLLPDRTLPAYFVEEKGEILGMIQIPDPVYQPQNYLGALTARQVMIPFNEHAFIKPESSLLSALTTMDRNHLARIPVIQDGQIAGCISREQVLRYIRLNQRLND